MTDIHAINLSAINLSAMRSPDTRPIIGVAPDQIDLERVAKHIADAVERGRYQGPTDPEEYLRAKHCLAENNGELCATVAGVMCFGRNPQTVFPRAVVDLGHYRGLDPVSFEVVHLEKDIGGGLFEQLARVESYLWTNIHHGMTISDSFQREEIHEYPRVVLRELTVNMIAHRDYTNFQSAARVQLFRNRIEWLSPGGLPPGITVENLLTEQASRNPVILSILYEAGLVEAFGQGLDTVVTVLARERMAPPIFRDTGASFVVTIAGRPWERFTTDVRYARLNDSQRRIVTLIRSHGEISMKEITALIEDRPRRSTQRDVRGLVEAGLIEAHGETRALRYRLIDNEL